MQPRYVPNLRVKVDERFCLMRYSDGLPLPPVILTVSSRMLSRMALARAARGFVSLMTAFKAWLSSISLLFCATNESMLRMASRMAWMSSLTASTMLVVGAPFKGSRVGASYTFSYNGSTWKQDGGQLVGTGAVGASDQGWSVALNDAVTVLAVGGQGDDNYIGATWTYTSP